MARGLWHIVTTHPWLPSVRAACVNKRGSSCWLVQIGMHAAWSAVRWVHPLVGSVYALPHVVISLFRNSDIEDLATGLLLSLGPMCGTLFRPKLDNRVTIYSSSRVNWKHSCSSSPEPFCRSISNEGPYKYSLLLLLLLLLLLFIDWSSSQFVI